MLNRQSIRSDKIALIDRGKAGILSTVSKILDTEQGLSKVIIDLSKTHIRVERIVGAGEKSADAYKVARDQQIEEYSLDGDNPYEDLFKVIDKIRAEELHTICILAGGKEFNKWLRIPQRSSSVFGVPILFCAELPPDVFLVCGSDDKDGDVEDVQYSIKCTLP